MVKTKQKRKRSESSYGSLLPPPANRNTINSHDKNRPFSCPNHQFHSPSRKHRVICSQTSTSPVLLSLPNELGEIDERIKSISLSDLSANSMVLTSGIPSQGQGYEENQAQRDDEDAQRSLFTSQSQHSNYSVNNSEDSRPKFDLPSFSQMSTSVPQSQDSYATPQNAAPSAVKTDKDLQRELNNQRLMKKLEPMTHFKLSADVGNPFALSLHNSPKSSGMAESHRDIEIPIYHGRFSLDFEYIREIGTGDFGSVSLCRNKLDRCMYAIKELRDIISGSGNLKRVLHECWALSGIMNAFSHSMIDEQLENGLLHIVRFFSCWIEDRKLFVQTEYCGGGNLASQLRHSPESFTDQRCRCILTQIASALAACHSLGVCHLDVKPANILETATNSNKYKLCDFGLAFPSRDSNHKLESPECGDGKYLSPELLQRDEGSSSEILFKSDIFSLGASLLELISGHPLPHSAARSIDLVEEIIFRSTVSRELQCTIKRMLDQDPSRRPSAVELMAVGVEITVQREGHHCGV